MTYQSDENVSLMYAVLLYNPNTRQFCICDARGDNPALNDSTAFQCRSGYVSFERSYKKLVGKAMKPKEKEFYENSLEKALEVLWTITFSGIRNYPLRVPYDPAAAQFYIEMRTAMEEKFPAVTKGGFTCGRRMFLPRLATETLDAQTEAAVESFVNDAAGTYGWMLNTKLADDYCRPSKYHNVYDIRQFMREQVNDGRTVADLSCLSITDERLAPFMMKPEIESRLMLGNMVPMLLNRIRELEAKNA